MATIRPYPAAFSLPIYNLSRGKHSAIICQSITDTALLQTPKTSHSNLKTSLPRRDLTFKLLGSFALSSLVFPLVDSSSPAYGFLEADNDEELLEKVKADRKKRLQKRDETNKLKSKAVLEACFCRRSTYMNLTDWIFYT
ncbi:hypothetical protein SUGI_1004660 [Cryptomeria japonica]|nr:hypothetical protein SUGI_1004660 [Cryptomeria japonica]